MHLLPRHHDDIIEKIKATYLKKTQLDSEVIRWKHKFINSSWSHPTSIQEGLGIFFVMIKYKLNISINIESLTSPVC